MIFFSYLCELGECMSNKDELITLEKAFLTYASYGLIRTNDSMYPYFFNGLNCIAIRDYLIERGFLKLATINESIPYYPYNELRKILKAYGGPVGSSREQVTKNVRDNIQEKHLYRYFGYCCYIPTELGKRFVRYNIDFYAADLQLLTLKIIDLDRYTKYTDLLAYKKAQEIEKEKVLSEVPLEEGTKRIYSKLIRYKKPIFMTYSDDSVDSSEDDEKVLYIKDQINRHVNMYDKDGSIKYYFSVEDSIVDIIINKYLSKKIQITKLDKFDENDFSENYVAVISREKSLYENLLLWMMITEKIGFPTIYGIPLYYFCVGIDISYKYRNYEQVKNILYDKVANSSYEIMKYFSRIYPVQFLLELNSPLFSYKKSYSTVNEIQMKEEYDRILILLTEKNLIPARWKSEFSLFVLVSLYFEDAIFQYRASWLEGQSLDIYIPQHKIAIEYQGIQHYEAIDYFGGEDAYKAVQRRDNEKKLKCDCNDVTLLYWSYQTEISDSNLIEMFENLNIKIHKRKETEYKPLLKKGIKKGNSYCKEKSLIVCYDLKGYYVNKYDTLNVAAEVTGCSTTSISKVLNGKRNSAGGYIWKKYSHTEHIPYVIDVCFNTSLINIGKTYTVEQYSINGELVKVFDSVRHAAEETNISKESIKKVVNGRTKTAGGYIWKKVAEINN